MYDVIATLPTQCGSHACMVVLHAYARRHCMSTARVSAIPTPRSVTCRGRFIVPGVTNPLGYRTHVGSSAEVASARQGRRPPAAHIQPHAPSQSARCVIIVIENKSNGSPGHGCTWELALPLLLARRHAELGQTAPPAARVGPIPASASSNDLSSERRGATPADARPWRCNTGSQTSQRTSANLEIEIHKPRRACRQTLPAEFTNLGLQFSKPSKSFSKPPLQCGHTQGFMLPNLCFFIAKPKVNV